MSYRVFFLFFITLLPLKLTQANVIDQVEYQGTIFSDRQDNTQVGDSYSLTFTWDPTTFDLNQSATNTAYSNGGLVFSPTSQASITGVLVYGSQKIQIVANYSLYNTITAEGTAAGTYISNLMYDVNTSSHFVAYGFAGAGFATDTLFNNLSFNIPSTTTDINSNTTVSYINYNSISNDISGSVTRVTISGTPASVPLPASAYLFIVGILGIMSRNFRILQVPRYTISFFPKAAV
jgi:hypothetical protein